MKLNSLNLQELSREEMVNITGGSFIGRVWKRVKSHLGFSSNEIPSKDGGYADSTHLTATWEF